LLAAGVWALAPAGLAQTPAADDGMQLGATRFAAGENVRIAADAEDGVLGDTYVAANRLETTGTIHGDLLVSAGVARILGPVGGDVAFAGGEARFDEPIGGDLRWFGGTLELSAPVASDALVAGGRIHLLPESRVGGLLGAWGGLIELSGHVEGPARISGGEVELSGTFDGDVHVRCDSLAIAPQARIAGDLVYEARRRVEVPEGTVQGEVRYSPRPLDDEPIRPKIETGLGYLSVLAGVGFKTYLAFTAFVAGLLMIVFLRPFVDGALAEAASGSQLIIAFGVGLVSMLVMLMLGLLCLLLLPLGLGIWAALAALLYFGGLVGKMIAGLWLLKPLRARGAHPVLGLLLGVVLLFLLGLIPVLGNVAWLFVTVTGMGACLLRIRSAESDQSAPAPAAGPPPPPAS
jgi:hypothetical protein